MTAIIVVKVEASVLSVTIVVGVESQAWGATEELLELVIVSLVDSWLPCLII